LTLFHNIKELRPLYKELKENMDLNFGRVDSGTGKFNPDKLISLVNNILSLSNNSYDTIEAINHLHKFAQYEGIIRELGESRKLNKLSKRSNGSKTIKNKIPDPKGLAVFSKIAFKNDIISIQELGLESCQDAPPHRHFDFTLHQIQIGYRKFPLLRLRMVEHNGRPGILIFLGESNHKPPLYHWKLSGEEGGYPYMLIIPQDELGQKYLVASTSSDIILIRESVRLFAGKLDATTEQGNAFQRKEWIRISRRFLELLDDIPPRLHYDDISTSYREEIYQFTLTNAWTSAKGFIPALELSWNNYIFDISTPTGASLPITNWPGDIIKMGARLSIDLNLKGNWDLQRVFWKSMTSNDRQFLLSIATELPNLIHHLVDRNPELKSNRETLDKQAKVVLSYAQALAIGRNPKRFLGLFNFWRNCK
jgi:hypothetical protein